MLRLSSSGNKTTLLSMGMVGLFGCTEDIPDLLLHSIPHIVLETYETLPGEFVSINAVRELSDGSVLVADRSGRALYWIDSGFQKVEQIGATGDGPQEYRSVEAIFALSGDSTAVRDGSGNRLMMMSERHIVGAATLGSNPLRITIGMDTTGGMLLASPLRGRSAGPGDAWTEWDSLMVVRALRDGTETDTIARLHTRRAVSVQTDRALYTYVDPLSPPDAVLLLPDGWVALVQPEPYRVSWVSATGQRVVGPSIAHDRYIADDAAIALALSPPGAPVGEGVPEHFYGHGYFEKPRNLPPFIATSVTIGHHGVLAPLPDGNVVVRRTRTEVTAQRYDVFDRTGVLAAIIMLPPEHEIIGTGRSSLYVRSTDAWGVQQLHRAMWPDIGPRRQAESEGLSQ